MRYASYLDECLLLAGLKKVLLGQTVQKRLHRSVTMMILLMWVLFSEVRSVLSKQGPVGRGTGKTGLDSGFDSALDQTLGSQEGGGAPVSRASKRLAEKKLMIDLDCSEDDDDDDDDGSCCSCLHCGLQCWICLR